MDRNRVWVVIPTYNERDNLQVATEAVLGAVRDAHLLIVDDNSPDGTGRIAEELAAHDPHISVIHRPGKQGLGPAYREGFRAALARGAATVVQMDCDLSHDPAVIPIMLSALERADLVLGSRYVPGGGTENWGLARRILSRGGCTFARTVLSLPIRDVTGGFKAWRAELLERIKFEGVRANGYGFQIEMTWRAARAGARILEVPIVFRERIAGQSKMTWQIAAEAALMVLRLRLEGLRRAKDLDPGASFAGKT